MTDTTRTYQLFRITKDKRSGENGLLMFDSYDTLATARTEAKKHLKNFPWAIFESRLVARSVGAFEFLEFDN